MNIPLPDYIAVLAMAIIIGALAWVSLLWALEAYEKFVVSADNYWEPQPTFDEVLDEVRFGKTTPQQAFYYQDEDVLAQCEEYYLRDLGVWVRFDDKPCIQGSTEGSEGVSYLTVKEARRLLKAIRERVEEDAAKW